MYTEIKTFEDACNKLQIQPTLPDVSGIEEDLKKVIISSYKLHIIAKAINEGWKPDWRNSDQWKYYPWFRMSRPGVGFAYDGYAYGGSRSTVGSRLCFETSEKANYFGQTFIDLYRDVMVIE